MGPSNRAGQVGVGRAVAASLGGTSIGWVEVGPCSGVGWVEMDEGGAYSPPFFIHWRSGGPHYQRGGGRTRSKLKPNSALVGSGEGLSGRERSTRPRVGKVCSDHGLRSEAMLSMWRGGGPRCRWARNSIS